MSIFKNRTRIIAAAAILFVLSSFFMPSALAAGINDYLYKYTMQIADNTSFSSVIYNDSSGSRQEGYYVEYLPNSRVSPIVVYGSRLYGKSTINDIISYASSQGKNVFAAINGDFFDTTTGLPIGLVVREGRLVSSDAWQNAIGFMEDGTAIIGRPELLITLSSAVSGNIKISYVNKLRTNAGIYLLTEDFSASTHASSPGKNAVLEILDGGSLKIGGSVRLRVRSVDEASSSSEIPSGCMVLTGQTEEQMAAISNLAVGEEVTISVSASSDARWNDVLYGVGAGDMLISNGKISSSLSSSSKNPRSALGIKADGTVVLLAVDGRKTGISAGLSLSQLANDLASLGCVSAINLDGGGSTALALTYPGNSSSSSPSDGSLRKCANYIMLSNEAAATGTPAKLYIYPYNCVMLKGASQDFTVKAVDSGFYPASVDAPSFESSSGTMSNGRFTSTIPGDVTITASASGLAASAIVKVVDRVDAIFVSKEGASSAMSSLSVKPGESVDLSASATYDKIQLVVDDSLFSWSFSDPSIGTIDKNGVFKAGNKSGVSGTISVSYGSIRASVPVTIGTAPFMIQSFEGTTSFSYANPGADSSNAVAITSADGFVARGRGAGKVEYDFGVSSPGTQIKIAPPSPISLNKPNFINLWVYGDGSGNLISLDTANSSGVSPSISVSYTLDFKGYKLLSFALPENTVSFKGIIIQRAENGARSGSIYLDHVLATDYAALSDTSSPAISFTSPDVSASLSLPISISATITDDGADLKKSNISLSLDGKNIDFSYSSYKLTAKITSSLSPGLHVLTIIATDYAGNISKKTLNFTYGGASPSPFADMDGHWASSYVNFLNGNGVISGVSVGDKYFYYPEKNTTRAEMAALITRYLGIDVAKYENVALPYTDKDSIAQWALPYVRAMYATGLMQGKSSSSYQGVKFDPSAPITRAEAMTILGRTLPNGYPSADLSVKDKADVPSYAVKHVKTLIGIGVVSGYADNTIRPANNIKRSEIAAMLQRMY